MSITTSDYILNKIIVQLFANVSWCFIEAIIVAVQIGHTSGGIDIINVCVS